MACKYKSCFKRSWWIEQWTYLEGLRKSCYFTALKLLQDLNVQFCVNLHILRTEHDVSVWEHGLLRWKVCLQQTNTKLMVTDTGILNKPYLEAKITITLNLVIIFYLVLSPTDIFSYLIFDICLFRFRSKKWVHNVVHTASAMPTFLPRKSGELWDNLSVCTYS